MSNGDCEPSGAQDRKEPARSAFPAPPDGAGRPAPPGELAAGRYHLLAEHVSSGSATVWRARDVKLDREVAVKRPNEHLGPRSEQRRRFASETRRIAQLEHPGVAPVYDAGGLDGAGAFCALKLVRGESLAAAIERVHALPARDCGVEERRLLNAFLRVCQTLAFSHARGVVHGELRPESIVLGDFGETVVLDWGPAAPANECDDAGADVGALGAILYRLLTGRSPAPGAGTETPPAPRTVRPAIPRALEAICLKAMACDSAAAGYPGVAELTRDVQLQLAGEPVSAWAEPWLQRLGRWMRRHRAAVTGIATTVAVALLGLGAVAVVLAVTNQRLAAAYRKERAAREEADTRKTEADAARTQAEAAFAMARDAVDSYYTRIADSPDLRARGLEGLRRTLLGSAAGFYEEFAAERAADPTLDVERGWAILRLGHITAETDSTTAALALFDRGRAHFERLAAAHPEDPYYDFQLTKCLDRLGNTFREMGDHPRSESCLTGALERLDEVSARGGSRPAAEDVESQRALTLSHLAILYNQTGRIARAETALREALAIHRARAARWPDRPWERYCLASAHLNLAETLSLLGRADQAAAECETGIELCRGLLRDEPAEPRNPELLARSQNNLGAYYRRANRLDKAEAALREAKAARQALAGIHPDALRFLADLSSTEINLGGVYLLQGRSAEALVELEAARKTREVLVARQPDLPEHRSALAGIHYNLASLHGSAGRLDEALAAYLEAARLFDALVVVSPADSRHAVDAASAWASAGFVARRRGDAAQAVKLLDRAVAGYEEILARLPDHAAARQGASASRIQRAQAHEALAALHAAVADWRRAVELAPAASAAALRLRLGLALGRAGDHEPAAELARELARAEPGGAQAHLDAARVLELAARAAAADARLPGPVREETAAAHAAAAVRELEEARRLGGFRDPAARQALGALVGLHGRPDYHTFLQRLGE